VAAAQAATAPRGPLFRGKVDDGPPAPRPAPAWASPGPVTLPPPEQLGVAPTPAAPRPAAPAEAGDWNATHARPRQLGAGGGAHGCHNRGEKAFARGGWTCPDRGRPAEHRRYRRPPCPTAGLHRPP